MNSYLIVGLLVLYGVVVWVIAATKYYGLGYDHAIEDVLKITETMKKSINKNSELHED
jgi:hypothetical protein